ncbi:SH3 domain-containing protein [Variovorax boronicumulans]|uniref:SH3 domain-containing protein n=1 Tax=Variovorax boronicumulans TaxID=436515 RepID=UPI00339984A8
MSLNLDQFEAASVGSTFAREVARMEQERASLREAFAHSVDATQQFKELARAGSVYSQIAKELTESRSTAALTGQRYKDLLAGTSPASKAVKAWQESQRDQQEHIRKMLEPLADIRKSFMRDEATGRLIKEAALGTTIRDQFKDVFSGLSGVGSVAKMWAQQMEEARIQTRSAFEGVRLGSAIGPYFKDFEQINKQWRVPSELLDVVASLKVLRGQIGKVALPTIDWSSAAALAKLMGEEGLEEQLAHLGIKPDGSLQEQRDAPEKGLLSRKQSDAVALVGLLLAIIGIWMTIQIFFYQENAGKAQQATHEEQAAKQLRQLESLNRLVEKALEQAAKAQEERFVVRERTATIRSKPEHGSAVEGKLMPNEVARAVDRKGRWVEVEYYHWLHEEYRTGWVLKRYLERVPSNYSKPKPKPKL